ncbi:unnamed protein product [Dicrocoelium dendriticum]|nr:unnamed protein product [Dicrocoelium dendriticum]
MRSRLIVLTLAGVLLIFALDADAGCNGEGEKCSGSLGSRCCGTLQCDMKKWAHGVCRTCVRDKNWCFANHECCSKRCKNMKCY